MRFRRGQDRRRLLLGLGNQLYVPSDTTGLQLVLDYRAGMLQTVGGAEANQAGHLVGEWVDQHTSGNNFSQTTSANKPVLVDDGGLLVPDFDGISDFLERVSLLSAGGNSARTLFMLAKAGAVGNFGLFAINYTQSGAGAGRAWDVTPEVAVRVVSGFESYDAALSTSVYQVLSSRNPLNSTITQLQAYIGSVELTATGGGGPTVLNIQGTATAIGIGGGTNAAVRVKAIWFYNVEKSDAERLALETEMAAIP